MFIASIFSTIDLIKTLPLSPGIHQASPFMFQQHQKVDFPGSVGPSLIYMTLLLP